MSDPDRWFEFSSPSLLEATHHPVQGVTYRLSRADTPRGFWLTIDKQNACLSLRFEYSEGNEERLRMRSTVNLDIGSGVHSNRLFLLRIRNLRGLSAEAEGGAPVNTLARQLLSSVKREFDQAAQQDSTPGARLNRQAASQGLRLDDSVPPAWMINAMQHMSGRSSSSPDKS